MFFETFFGLAKDGKTNAKALPNPLNMAVILREYRDEIRLAGPPAIVQTALFTPSQSWAELSATAAGTRDTPPTRSPESTLAKSVISPSEARLGASSRRQGAGQDHKQSARLRPQIKWGDVVASESLPRTAKTFKSSENAPLHGLSRLAAGLVILLVLLTAAAIVIALVMANAESIKKDTLWYEIGKLVAQAGILTGFGALLTLLVHEFQKAQEDSGKRVAAQTQQLADRHAWLRDFAERLTDAYGSVKQSRRSLQWALETTEDGSKYLPTKNYEKQLKQLSIKQTEFESLHTLAETYFAKGDPAEAVVTNLKSIIDRLSDIVSERKRIPPRHPEEDVRMTLATRKVIRGFTAASDECEFKESLGFGHIKKCYKKILDGIIDELQESGASTSKARRRSRRPKSR